MLLQDPAHPKRVLTELARLLSDPAVERLRVAVAYANVGGVRALQTLLAGRNDPVQVEIVVTLDMGITRKAALEVLLSDFPGAVRAITTPSGIGTFHTKAFVVDRGGGAQRVLLGSANLTDAALTRNYEAVSVTDLTPEQGAAWEAWWANLLEAADELTEDLVAAYTERRPPPGRRERIADEDIETREDGSSVTLRRTAIDARDAEWLVIDWGGTGGYRVQCELPKVAAAFFHPETDHERPLTIRYEGRDYSDNQLRFYPDNGMVRINLDSDIGVVADASITREASVFRRVDDDHYELRLVDPAERAERLAEAALMGGADHTRRHDNTRREFGWV